MQEASWEARFKSEPAEKMRLTRHRLEKFGEEHFGPLDDKTVEKARTVTADVLAVPAASLEELDLGRLLAMLYYSETEEAKAVREAVLRVGVAPPSVPGASGSVQEQLRQMILQQQQQVQAQQQQQQHMVVMLQQMQQQVQALQAQVSQPDLQQQARGQPAAQAADPAPLQGAPAVAESEMPMMQLDAKPVIAGYPEDAADVRGWEEAMATDVAGLVRDLRLKYVSGAQSESLTDSFRRLRDWINGVAQGGGWVYNPEIVRLGNDLLQEIFDLVASKVGAQVSRSVLAKHRESAVSSEQAVIRMRHFVGQTWADSTVRDRQNLWRRFQVWADSQGLATDPDSATRFVMATMVEPQGMLSYTRLLSAVFGHIGVDARPLLSLATVLRGSGGSIPLEQAPPVPREVLVKWAFRQVPQVCAAVLLAWKTASRWDDVRTLPRVCFPLITSVEIVVDWKGLPKGRRSNPFCRSKVVAVRGPLTQEIAALLLSMGSFSQLCPLSTQQFGRLMDADETMRPYSAHSIKRGAVEHLMDAKANGAPFPAHLISRLAKHTDDADPTVTNMTIRYTTNPVALARVLQTGEVTMGKRTRLPRTEEEKAAPLHVDSVPPMKVDVLRRRMNPQTRARFDTTWARTFYPQVRGVTGSSECRPSRFEAAHALELEEHAIAQRSSEPGGPLNVPFTVVEEKEGKLRQRFILWTYDANATVETDGYQAHVPLCHVSEYLHAVDRECGSTRDFRCGFYGIEIPPSSRALFSFQDSAGRWWQLTRLPMGHSCAPELMHTLASTAAGHPDYVVSEHAAPSEVLVHIWVDNIRYAGPRDQVLAATTDLDALATQAHITWKAADTMTAAKRYEFIGVDWHHADRTRGRRELLVRLSCAHAEGVVEGSGRDGGFWRPIEKAARDAMPVVALSEDVSREAAMAILGKAGRAWCGLVLGTKRLLLRVRGAGGLEQVRAAAGKHAAAPLVLAPRFMVTGAKPREHEADVVADLRRAGWAVEPVSAFVRGGSRTCVVATIEPPPFRVLERGNAPPLVVNDYDRSELPREARKKLAGAGGPVKTRRVKLPAAEAGAGPATSLPATQGTKRKGREPEEPAKAATVEPGILQRVVEGVVNALSPPRQRLRVSGEDEEMTGGPAIDATAGGQEQGGHRHSFDTSRVSKPKNGFTCAICKEEKLPKQVRRACKGCDIFACQLCSKC
ncbi:hypothetical protein DIPPA_13704 [Diplonema papillatum]|nr:hypothetical protein DIPPA_13704 [Diplonema papillatum]